MTEHDTPQDANPTDLPKPAAPKRRRWKRWLMVVGVLVLMLLVIVALLPTILGLSPVRNFVAGQISSSLDGHAEIGELSVGWFSPTKLGGVRVYDNQKRLALDISKLEVESTLLELARNPLHLGKVNAVVDVTQLTIRTDGQTSYHDIFNIGGKPTPSDHPASAQGDAEVPDVQVDLTLDLRGMVKVVDARGENISTLQIRPGTGGTVKIDNINSGIAPDLKLVYDVEGGKPGTLTINGSVDAFEKNKLDLAALAAQLKIGLENVDLSAARPVLVLAKHPEINVGGVANGPLNVDLKDGQSGSIKGIPTVTNLVFAHPSIKDEYRAKLVSLPVDVTRTVRGESSQYDIDIKAIAPELTASIVGTIPQAAIDHLVANDMPGANGHLTVTLDAKPDVIASSFPKTLKLRDDVKVNAGAIRSKTEVWLQPEAIVYAFDTTIQAKGEQAGKPIEIEPVHFVAAGSLKSLAEPIKGLRDLSVSMASKFASFKASGASLASVNGGGDANLDLLRDQIAQFVDLQGKQLAGRTVFNVDNKQVRDNAFQIELNATFTGIKASIPGQPPVDVGYAKLGVNGTYALSETTSLQAVETARVLLVAGDNEKTPLVDVALKIDQFDPSTSTIRHFDAEKIAVSSLPKLQQMLAPFVPQLKVNKIEVQSGSLYLASKGSADLNGRAATLENIEVSAPSLRVSIDGKPALDEKKFYLSTAGKVHAGDVISLDLSRLSFESAIATLSSKDKPVQLVLGGGIPTGEATLNAILNLVQLNRIAKLFSADPIPTVTEGLSTGELFFSSDDGRQTLKYVGKIDSLTIDKSPVSNETLTLDLGAVIDAQKTASVSGTIKGSFLTLTVSDTKLNLAAGTPVLKRVETAKLVVGVPDAQKAAAVAQAIVPGLAMAYTPAGGISITAGFEKNTATLDVQASQLTLTDTSNNKVYRFERKKRVSLLGVFEIAGANTIEKITATKLEGDLDIVQLAMIEPIVITDPMGTPTPSGRLRVSGTIERVTPLLQFIQRADKPLPFKGLFEFTPAFTSSGSTLAFTPEGTVTDFAVLDDAGKPTFTEKQVSLTGDLSADLSKKSASIKSFTIDMISSKAATIVVTGGVRNFDKDVMQLDNVVAKINAVGDKAWPIIFPLLPPEQQQSLAKAKISGPITVDVTANGAYAKGAPTFNEAIKPLKAVGQISLARADLNEEYGLEIANFQQFFSIDHGGRLVTGREVAPGKYEFAPAFDVNGGKGDLGSIVIVLSDPNMPVSIGRKQKLLTNVKLNPVMAAQLGSLASVMFKDSKTASGLVDVIVVDCNNVPLADLLAGSKKAKAEFVYNINDLRLDGPVPSALASVMSWGDNGIVGRIQNGSLVLKDGIAYQDMTIDVLKSVNTRDAKTGERKAVDQWQQLTFKGGIELERQRFKDYSLWMSRDLLLQDWRKSFPQGATVQLKGNVSDVGSIMTQTIGSLAVQGYGGSLIDDLLNKTKK